MLGLQPIHVLIIVVVAILLFAPSRLPETVRSLGKTVREFRVGLKDADSKGPAEAGAEKANPKEPSR